MALRRTKRANGRPIGDSGADLPPKGRLGLSVSSWYHQPIQDFVYNQSSRADFNAAIDRITAFERTLADDGSLIIKFWMYMDKAMQQKPMKALEKYPLQASMASAGQTALASAK